jgi:hypothetical protein
MRRGSNQRAGKRGTERGPGHRIHVAIRLNPNDERSRILGSFSSVSLAKEHIEGVDAIGGWVHLPTNPHWVSEAMPDGCFWELLALDVDEPLTDGATQLPTFTVEASQ